MFKRLLFGQQPMFEDRMQLKRLADGLKLLCRRHHPPVELSVAIRQLGMLYFQQCNAYTSLRIRRWALLLQLYKQLYNANSLSGLLRTVVNRLRVYRGSTIGGSLALSMGFTFRNDGISDEEMSRISKLLDQPANATDNNKSTDVPITHVNEKSDRQWELVIDKKNFKLYRRPSLSGAHLYEYKCYGTFTDVPAWNFFATQMDLEYRKQWDQLVITLEIVDRDHKTGNEVIRWVTHYPYPMYSREYIFVRRACIDPVAKKMVLVSKAVEHHECPVSANHVRVEEYFSCMVIQAHTDMHEDGFDYVLTYFDDPKAPIPTPAYNWMARTGVPGFVDQVYVASKTLSQQQLPAKAKGELPAKVSLNFPARLAMFQCENCPNIMQSRVMQQ